MKYLSLVFVLFTTIGFAQKDLTEQQKKVIDLSEYQPAIIKVPSCNQSEIQASKLAASGQFVYVTAGNLDNSRTDFELLLEKYLWEKHAIKTEVLSTCTPMVNEMCYMNAMNAKWKARFGEDFVFNKQKELKAAFEKQS